MNGSPPHVMDASAIVDLFRGHVKLNELLLNADKGGPAILMPTTAMADAESELTAGANAWVPILMIRGVRSLELTEHAAIEIGPWPGSPSCRHAAHEARASGAVVLTTDPAGYTGLQVALTVV